MKSRYFSIRPAVVALIAALSAAGCATLDTDSYKEASYALNRTDDTFLGGRAADILRDARTGESAFYVIDDGVEALALRLATIARAERSVDVQTYLIKDDTTSKLFIGALLQAADRGVRVRLLLDDVFTGGNIDSALRTMAMHPRVEVRIFNPFARRRLRALDGITDFGRVNRRMHNKSFTVDNQLSIFGGRNIADEYFSATQAENFLDLDVLTAGPLVPEISDMFDEYWNHRLAVPMSSLVSEPADPAGSDAAMRAAAAAAFESILDTEYGEALFANVVTRPDDAARIVHATYELVYDSPDKSEKRRDTDIVSMVAPLEEAIAATDSQLLVISPYFVPRKAGVRYLTELAARGIDVMFVTNSLAANNHWVVHSGYAPSRKPLLRGGVRLFEVRPDVPYEDDLPASFRAEVTTLHTKAAVLDSRRLFIGSFNWDPRSVNINTEMGVIIDSPRLAQIFVAGIESALPVAAYEVGLTANGALQWTLQTPDGAVQYSSEPDAGFGRRFLAGFAAWLPIKGQL